MPPQGGFVDGTKGITVTINRPPASGPRAGNPSAVEVIIAQPQTLNLVRLFTVTPFNVRARAVALKGAGGDFCVLATDTGSATAVSVSNGANVVMDKCGLAVNASGSSALSVTGGAALQAQSESVVGQAKVSNGGSINPPDGLKVNQPATTDPYANVSVPTPSGCTPYQYGFEIFSIRSAHCRPASIAAA